jgi:hypothetical protein
VTVLEEETPSLLRHRGKRHKLSLEDRIDVVWRVVIEKEPQ